MTVHIHIHTGIHSMAFIYGLIHSFIITHIARSHGPTETTQGILSPTSKALSSPKLAGSSRSSLESKNLHWATVSALKNPNECGEMGDGGSYFLLVKWGHLFKKLKKMSPTCCVGKGLSHELKKNWHIWSKTGSVSFPHSASKVQFLQILQSAKAVIQLFNGIWTPHGWDLKIQLSGKLKIFQESRVLHHYQSQTKLSQAQR